MGSSSLPQHAAHSHTHTNTKSTRMQNEELRCVYCVKFTNAYTRTHVHTCIWYALPSEAPTAEQ